MSVVRDQRISRSRIVKSETCEPPVVGLVRTMSPEPWALEHVELPEYGLGEKVAAALEGGAPGGWGATGLTRSYYLDMAEKIVREARDWQDEGGAIVDPVAGTEEGQTSSRYVSPGAVLLAFGRVDDLAESIFLGMDWCCRRLVSGKAKSPDFWMRELMTAFLCLQPIAEPERLAHWAADLSSVDPDSTYWQVRPDGTALEKLHNWTVYAAAGEVMRQEAGLAPEEATGPWGNAFFAKYMPSQLLHFTENGMYRDPNDPITYDITTRLQIATALAFGYDGPLRQDLAELLRRGGLTQLLLVSAAGYVPFGGRSSQYHFQEVIITALCELEARRYKETDPRLAGAFKRQAHLSAKSIARWLEMEPFRHLKNGFPPDNSHGLDSYGKYSVYSLLVASFFGLAAIYADDEIEEAPCPAELGGYVFQLEPAFHKVFCTCGDSQLEIDTRAHFAHDATGLGRFCRTGVPLELGLAMPITTTPVYTLAPEHLADRNMAIGPEWRRDGTWQRLAALSDGLTCRLQTDCETRARVAFRLTYHHAESGAAIVESYDLQEGVLHYRAEATVDGAPADAIRLIVPILATDGEAHSTVRQSPGGLSVDYRGARLAVSFDESLSAELSDKLAGNRNGLHQCFAITAAGHRIEATLALDPATTAEP